MRSTPTLGRGAWALGPLAALLVGITSAPDEAFADGFRQRPRSRPAGAYRQRARPHPTKPPPPPPYLLLARRAIVAGKIAEAERQLARARRCFAARGATCGFERASYQLVAGVLYLERGQLRPAVRSLEASLKTNPKQPGGWLYLGQALFRLERYRRAASALERARPVGLSQVGYHLLLARALERSRRPEAARRVLAVAITRFPKDTRPLRELASLYAAQGLYLTAASIIEQLGRRASGARRRRLALMRADYLRRGGQRAHALALLERTRLAFPRDAHVLRRLAYTYADAEQPLAAARLGAQAALGLPTLAHFVAAQYRLAGDTQRALAWNARVSSRRRRLRQRATILLAARAWQRASTALETLLGERQLGARGRVQLAYAALKSRRPQLARRALAGLPASRTVRLLRQAVADCKTTPACSP